VDLAVARAVGRPVVLAGLAVAGLAAAPPAEAGRSAPPPAEAGPAADGRLDRS